ncbi:uncharacterized protein LOC116345622 isoform X2 [Contarinia nasturtii]|nr:uncharacterized protein LOC116345622 isoform X2 [Contarinia nasturtii]XP_031630967.1 uncharacterized protein LOC116345622 isoform X2 [Contarinia nasturtii]
MDTTDNETGEVKWTRPFQAMDTYDIDLETGECDSNHSTRPIRKTTFVIPKELIQPPKHKGTKLHCMDAHENYTLFKKEQVIGLQEDIILGCNKTSFRLFLLPSFFLFFRLCAPVIEIIEIFLHVWAHKKNAKNTDENFYYRSPLHIVTSQFCAVCRMRKQIKPIRMTKLRKKKQTL